MAQFISWLCGCKWPSASFGCAHWSRSNVTLLQPINLVESPEFCRFALYGRKGIKDSDFPHRTALTDHIFQQYLDAYDTLVKEIKGSLGRVSLTSDIWSNPQLASFLAMTAHWCRCDPAGRLEIANRLLAFHLVEGAHDSENIGQIMYDIIKDAKANRKVHFLQRLWAKMINKVPRLVRSLLTMLQIVIRQWQRLHAAVLWMGFVLIQMETIAGRVSSSI